jgi:hypothetical protein
MLRLLLGCALLVIMVGCSTGGATQNDGTNPNPPREPAIQSISLRRAGGIAGFDDRILINQQGAIITSGRALGVRRGTLTPEQLTHLAQLFMGFERLEGAYPPPDRVADDLQYQLTYGAKVVRASTANEDLPQQFRAIVQALEQIAASLPVEAR